MTHPSIPEIGFYKTRLGRGCPILPVRITYTASQDDRSPMWVAVRDSEYVDIFDVWPGCSASRISEAEYNFLTASREHDKRYGHADARKPIDLNARKTVF